jgi:exodeoxyribonuclease VII large subunit
MRLMNSAFPNPADGGRRVLTVSALNREARALLESGFPSLWVEGELSNVARPSSGHLYFSLKDAGAQVRCAMFRNRNIRLAFAPRDGLQVLVRARVSLYEQRGEFQLIVEHMEPAGDGALRAAFERLKAKLQAEGLFAEARKRPLPVLPRCVGVITSPTGAAVRDVLTVLRRRFPAIRVIVYPVAVQGADAAPQIVRALQRAGERAECDVLFVGRGGGSLEDLWAFNEEAVARAIAACPIPVVAGVGHEVDFTIADFVADRRAPTPSGAAEIIAPDAAEWLQRLAGQAERLRQGLEVALGKKRERLDWIGHRLQMTHPGQRVRQQAQRIDELEQRLANAWAHALERRRTRLVEARSRLRQLTPVHRIARLGDRVASLERRQHGALERTLERLGARLDAAARGLQAVSPLATLDRGYAIVEDQQGRVVRDSLDVRPGERIVARLARGRLSAVVEDREPPEESS